MPLVATEQKSILTSYTVISVIAASIHCLVGSVFVSTPPNQFRRYTVRYEKNKAIRVQILSGYLL